MSWLGPVLGALAGAIAAACGVIYWLRDRLSAHATPGARREPARHAAPSRRVISRPATAAQPPAEFMALDSYPPPDEPDVADSAPAGPSADSFPAIPAIPS